MLAQVGNIKSNTLDEIQLQDVIMDIVTGAIRSTDMTVDLYRWSDFPSFTRLQQPAAASPLDSYTAERTVRLFPAVLFRNKKTLRFQNVFFFFLFPPRLTLFLPFAF